MTEINPEDLEAEDPEAEDLEAEDLEAEDLASEEQGTSQLRQRFARIMALLSSPNEAERLAATYALERLCQENDTDIVAFAMSLIDGVGNNEDRFREGYQAGWAAVRQTQNKFAASNDRDIRQAYRQAVRRADMQNLRDQIEQIRSTVRPTFAQRIAAERLTLRMQIDGLLRDIAYEANPAHAQERWERARDRAKRDRAKAKAEQQAYQARWAAREAERKADPEEQEYLRLRAELGELQDQQHRDAAAYKYSKEYQAAREELVKMSNRIKFLKGQLTRAKKGHPLDPKWWTPPRSKIPRPKFQRGV